MGFDAECLRVQAARNDLEAYVLDAQGEFAEGGSYFEYMTMDESDNFMNSIFQMDDWIAEDEFDQTAEVYNQKLESLQSIGNIYVTRCKESAARQKQLLSMRKNLNSVQSWLDEGCKAEDFAHIEASVLDELRGKIIEANAWLDERQQLSSSTAKNQDPPFYAEEVSIKRKELNEVFLAVRNLPKPEPKKEEKEENKDAD